MRVERPVKKSSVSWLLQDGLSMFLVPYVRFCKCVQMSLYSGCVVMLSMKFRHCENGGLIFFAFKSIILLTS